MYYARKIEDVLKHHTSSLSEITVYYQDENIGSEYWYATPELHCWLSGGDDGFVNTMTQSVLAEEIYPGGYATFIANSDEKYKEWFEGDYDDYSAAPLGSEKLYAYEEKDGQFIAYTELSDEEAVSDMIEGYHAAYGGYTYTQGMKLRFRYVFDLAASDWLNADTSIVDADGTEHKFMTNTYTYDKEFDYKRDGSPLHDYFNSKDNSRCITITFCPGTSDEVTREYTIPCNTGAAIYKGSDKISELYSDPGCTQLYAGGDGVSDLHLYVK